MKKLLTLLLVVAMVLGIVSSAMAATTTPSTVAGSKFSDIAGNKAEGDITLLAVKNIMKGDAGATTVRPDSTITRAEFAAMVVRMLGKETLATSLAQIKPATKDEIPAWAWGYVNLATSMGIMKGYPDGSFLPNNNVTFAEALAMLERGIGLDKKAIGTWPTNVLVVAYDFDLVDGVDVFADVPATRADVAVMMVNTMYTDKFLATDEDGVDHFGAAILDATTVTGVVTAVSPDANTINIGGVKTLATSVNLVGAKTFGELINLNVKAITVDSKIVFIEVTDDANVIVGTMKEFDSDTDGDYIKLTNGDKYYLAVDEAGDVDIDAKLNTVTLTDYTDLTENDSVVLNLVDNKVVFIDATRVNYGNAMLDDTEEVDSPDYTIDITTSAGANVDALELTTSTPVTIDGVAKKVTDLKDNDVVYVTTTFKADGTVDDTVLKVEAFRATIKGVVTSTRNATSGKYATIKLADGTSKEYKLSVITGLPTVGDTVEYRLNKAGQLRFNVSWSATAAIGYITDTYTTVTSDGTKYYVVLDLAGTEKTYQWNGDATDGDDNDIPDAFEALTTDTFVEYTTDIAGKIDDTTARVPDDVTDAVVVAVDKVNGIVTVNDDGTYRTFGVDGLVVYQDNDDGTFTSIGIEGLAKDDVVTFETGKLDLLVRNDQ